MNLWAILETGAGTRLGEGPVAVASARVMRKLDGAGTLEMELPATSRRVLDLVEVGHRLRLFVQQNGQQRRLGSGWIEYVAMDDSAESLRLELRATDEMAALARASVWMKRTWDNVAISTIVGDLAALAGWSANCAIADPVTLKLEGTSILNALIRMADETGYHVRQVREREIEFGAFGESSGIVARRAAPGVHRLNETGVIIVQDIAVETTIEDLCNRVMVLGGVYQDGVNEYELSLVDSTRTAPYTIQTMTLPDASTGYFLEDAASVATYGAVERVQRWNVQPAEPYGAPEKEAAANQLYDAAAAFLSRRAQPQRTYEISAVQAIGENIHVGDRIQLQYSGAVRDQRGTLVYINVNESLWVLSVEEVYSPFEMSVRMELSNVDRAPRSIAEQIVETIEITSRQVIAGADI